MLEPRTFYTLYMLCILWHCWVVKLMVFKCFSSPLPLLSINFNLSFDTLNENVCVCKLVIFMFQVCLFRCVQQEISSTPKNSDVTTNVQWTGTMSNNVVTYDGGYQVTLLPQGMYLGCPCDVSKSVTDSKSFHLEFCWLESAGKRQRLVRTYDVEGLAVSSTYFIETKL